MDVLGVTLVEDRKQLRKQLRLDFDWQSLNQMHLPPEQVVIDRLLDIWHNDPANKVAQRAALQS